MFLTKKINQIKTSIGSSASSHETNANSSNYEEFTIQQLAQSPIVPKQFQGNTILIKQVKEFAAFIKMDLLFLLNNITIIDGSIFWKSPYVISSLLKKISSFRIEYLGNKNDDTFAARGIATINGQEVYGQLISVDMAKSEGWYNNFSLWHTATQQMLSYRAATFFARLYAPDILSGYYTADEASDIDSAKKNKPQQIDNKPLQAQTQNTPQNIKSSQEDIKTYHSERLLKFIQKCYEKGFISCDIRRKNNKFWLIMKASKSFNKNFIERHKFIKSSKEDSYALEVTNEVIIKTSKGFKNAA